MPTGAIILIILFVIIVIGTITKPLWLNESEADKVKNNIEDCFDVDIHNIKSYGCEISDEDDEKGVVRYDVVLPSLQIGLFKFVEVIEFKKSNSYNLLFKGVNSNLTKQFVEFVNFLADKYGDDQFGKGRFDADKDYRGMKIGTFSRTWKGINLYIEDDLLYILMFNVEQNN